MKKILLLGAGRVGSAIALDLAAQYDVTVGDKNEIALATLHQKNKKINILMLDAAKKEELAKTILPFDLVVSAVPGFMGYAVLETIIDAGKNAVDISFFPEDALQLNTLAIEKGVTAIVDCGVAPGMDNIILGYHNERMIVEEFTCMVGGLPKNRKPPFEYKAPFSPADVIEEYLRPARYRKQGQMISADPLSYKENVFFKKTGMLEAIYTDGLRTLLQTIPRVPDMREMTLRYPGHTEKIKILKDAGFFSETTLKMNGNSLSPKAMTAAILDKEWKLEEGEPEFTVMKVTVKGMEDGKPVTVTYDLYDEYDPLTNISSMARTTGYTATAAVNLVLNGLYLQTGIIPPEYLGKDKSCFRFILDYLRKRGVVYFKK